MTNPERELFDENIRGLYAAIDANATVDNEHFKNISQTLKTILAQTTKTNGRVNAIELNDKDHLIACPQIARIDKINEELLEYKMMKKYPKFSIAAMVVFGGCLIALTLAQTGVI